MKIETKTNGRKRLATIAVLTVILSLSGSISYSAYMMHKDKDTPIVLEKYPDLKGTMLDNCALCHIGGKAPAIGDPGQGPVDTGDCDYCHYVVRTQERHVGLTLNSYGIDYLTHGADATALDSIKEHDSDHDGFSNFDELNAKTFPGDPDSRPGIAQAPHVEFSLNELKESGIPVLEQAIFVNVSKSREGDSYRSFGGFLIDDIIRLAGAKENTTSVDVISIDSYMKTFSVEQLGGTYSQGAPVFGFSKEEFGECGWVRYDVEGLKEGMALPDANVLLTFSMNGEEYGPANYDLEAGKLKGYGPFRSVAPQMVNPGPPDNSSKATPECVATTPPEFRYNHDFEKNSDYCVKTVVAIRVNPLPDGTMDYDWVSGAVDRLNNSKIIVYGNIGQ